VCNGFAAVGPGASIVPAGVAPLPTSFVGLNSVRGNFPVSEKTSVWSGRLDQKWNNRNSSFVRVGVSPSLVTGIESTAQNQVFGQNAGSRTGVNQSRDISGVFQHDTIVNEVISGSTFLATRISGVSRIRRWTASSGDFSLRIPYRWYAEIIHSRWAETSA
jgi:hypothetical protein